ncbi:MAG: fatty acid desaturase [Alphaproteobacteria bacterium]|nr:fatty acid desaturase [Alphaproteobacteria bacterium]
MSTDSFGYIAGQTRQQDIRSLKARDNLTNFGYIGFIYLIMAVTLGVTLWSYAAVAEAGRSWWWNAPMTVLAIVVIGASQHQLGGIVHEGTHYILFADRKLNELASDWLAAFPIYTSTYAFRLHHLPHHQFVNDPKRDPNFDQAQESGHWLDFPIAHVDFLMAILKQLNPVRLVSYIVARAKYSAVGVKTNPYANPEKPGWPWTIRLGVLFMVAIPALHVMLISLGAAGFAERWLMSGIALAMLAGSWVALIAYYLSVPEEAFAQSRIDPVISHRATTIARVSYMALVYGALTVAEYFSGLPAWGYFGLLWILPLFTTFPLFMVLREWIQHGNADRGRYTNSRIFLVNPLLRYAVFPFGMDYHLPHHINASVPHYRLKDLHAYLLETDAKYADQALVVEGWRSSDADGSPAIVDVLGPRFTPRGNAAHVDDETLAEADVNDKAAISAQIAASRQAGSSSATR